MEKTVLIVAYWLCAIFLTAVLLTSLNYDLGAAVLMSLSFLPAALALSFFLPKVERTRDGKKRAFDTLCIILGVMMIIPTGPPEMKRVKRSVNGNMANTFLS